MGSVAHVRDARPEDVEHVFLSMRQADWDELSAVHIDPPLEILQQSVSMSVQCKVGVVNGDVVCIFGVGEYPKAPHIGIPWLIGTHYLDRHSRVFARVSRPVLQMLWGDYTRMVNMVDDRNTKAKRWLQWLGFRLAEPVPIGRYQVPFRTFWKERHEEQFDV